MAALFALTEFSAADTNITHVMKNGKSSSAEIFTMRRDRGETVLLQRRVIPPAQRRCVCDRSLPMITEALKAFSYNDYIKEQDVRGYAKVTQSHQAAIKQISFGSARHNAARNRNRGVHGVKPTDTSALSARCAIRERAEC